MASQKNFAVNPSVSITRSKFIRPSQHKTTFNLGELVPIYVDEVLPGDTRSIDLSGLIRMSTPKTDLMDNIFIDFYAFFVPNRLVWDHWKEFMGENTSAAGAQRPIYTIPSANMFAYGGVNPGSVGAYMGLPIVGGSSSKTCYVSVLFGRAYLLIYNEWFRDQNLIAPFIVTKNDSSNIGNAGPQTFYYSSPLLTVAKTSDYFTRALPYAQKGDPVSLPLGTEAPVYLGGSNLAEGQDITLGTTDQVGSVTVEWSTGSGDNNGALFADLTKATAATINDLRFAFQYQKLLEKDAIYGTRYWEILKAHFGITAPDASLQRPEYLGGYHAAINVDQVLATTGGTQALGTVGANSVTGFKNNLFTASFVEHGTLMILACARHDQTYCQGINRMWSRKARTDFYMPVFANLGAQEIKNKEIFANGDGNDDAVFGYQEAWSEYRYRPSIASGLIAPTANNQLSIWSLTNKFASLPTLGKVFIEQNRDNIQRIKYDTASPDFIADFYFNETAVRPMPMYSIPGLIDHH